jgi:hypothetical protein
VFSNFSYFKSAGVKMKFGMSKPRIYWHKGKPVPSVSTVMSMFKSGIPFNWPAKRAMDNIKNSLVNPDFSVADACNDAVNDAERYMNECADLGTGIHEAIATSFVTGVRLTEPSASMEHPELMDNFIYQKLLTNVWKWIDKYNVTPILVEKAMSNVTYAGTLDLFCELDSNAYETKKWCRMHKVDYPQPIQRVKVLLDWKVTASYYDDMPVKLAAYQRLLYQYGYKPEVMLIARFSKATGTLNIKDYSDEFEDSYITFNLACQLFHHNFKEYLNELEQEAERQRIARIERKK